MWKLTTVFLLAAILYPSQAALDAEVSQIYNEVQTVLKQMSQSSGVQGVDLVFVANKISSDIGTYLHKVGAMPDEEKMKALLTAVVPQSNGVALLNALFEDVINQAALKIDAALIIWDRLADLLPKVDESDKDNLYTILACLQLTSDAIARLSALTEAMVEDLKQHGQNMSDVQTEGDKDQAKRFWDVHCSVGKRSSEMVRRGCHIDRRSPGVWDLYLETRDLAEEQALAESFREVLIHGHPFGKRDNIPESLATEERFLDLHIHFRKRDESLATDKRGVGISKRFLHVIIHS